MNPQEYHAFTDALQHTLERDARVVALMAAGSMAGVSHQPDEWSDHDFWLVVEPGAQAWFVANTEWMPDSDQIVLYFQESHGGLKAIYRSGHLLEFAVSDREGLMNFRVNDYRMLIDRAGLGAELERMRHTTALEFKRAIEDDVSLMGQFITNLLVGVWRCRRGEYFSGRQLITVSSLYALLRLIPKYIPAPQPAALDNLDPLRRFEAAYPDIGAQINRLLQLDLNEAAVGLLDLADDVLHDKFANYPTAAVDAVRQRILTTIEAG